MVRVGRPPRQFAKTVGAQNAELGSLRTHSDQLIAESLAGLEAVALLRASSQPVEHSELTAVIFNQSPLLEFACFPTRCTPSISAMKSCVT